MNDIAALEAIERIHREGFGVSLNLWAEDDDFAVVLWRDGKPVSAGNAPSLLGALRRAAVGVGALA